jgi:hypothetical protein
MIGMLKLCNDNCQNSVSVLVLSPWLTSIGFFERVLISDCFSTRCNSSKSEMIPRMKMGTRDSTGIRFPFFFMKVVVGATMQCHDRRADITTQM